MKNLIFLIMFLTTYSAFAGCADGLSGPGAGANSRVIQDLIANKRATLTIGTQKLEIFVDEVRVLKPGHSYVFMNLRTKNPFAYFVDGSEERFCGLLGFNHGSADIYAQNQLGFFFHRPTMISLGQTRAEFGEWANYLIPNVSCFLSASDEPVDNDGQ